MIAMMKALFATALLALTGATVLLPNVTAMGPGVCVAISCAEVGHVDPANVQNNIQTCAGNLVVQVGVNNDANFCSGGNNTNGGH